MRKGCSFNSDRSLLRRSEASRLKRYYVSVEIVELCLRRKAVQTWSMHNAKWWARRSVVGINIYTDDGTHLVDNLWLIQDILNRNLCSCNADEKGQLR